MEKDKFYLIWYKDDRGQSRSRGVQFLRETPVDVEFRNVVTGRIESLFIGTFRHYRGRTKEYKSREELILKLEEMSQRRNRNGKQNIN